MIKIIFLLSILFSFSSALAYVPQLKTILSRTAKKHGSGVYSIHQDIFFILEDKTIPLHEHWIVKNGDRMKLTVSGRDEYKDRVQFAFLYNQNTRYQINESSSKLEHIPASPESIEPFFHFRYSKSFTTLLYKNKFIPQTALSTKKIPPNLEEFTYKPESFIRPARTGGGLCYAIGLLSPDQKKPPSLWIEQDHFLVKKVRFPSNAVVTTENFVRHKRNLWFPQKRTVLWEQYKVQIMTKSAQRIPLSKKTRSSLNSKSLIKDSSQQKMALLMEEPIIREFYSRFR